MFHCKPVYNASNEIMFDSLTHPRYVQCQPDYINAISSFFALIGWILTVLFLSFLIVAFIHGFFYVIKKYSFLSRYFKDSHDR